MVNKITITLLLVFFSFQVFSQKKTIVDTNCINIMPEFIGGEDSLMRFLAKNLKYPAINSDNEIQGKVQIQFVVLEDGSISNPKIIIGTNESFDLEAKKLIESMPKWKPGLKCGKKEPITVNFPIFIFLQD